MNVPQLQLEPHVAAARAAHDHNRFSQWDEAAERGRRMAAAMIAENPEQRKLVESVYGKAYCRNRYPEAYRNEKS